MRSDARGLAQRGQVVDKDGRGHVIMRVQRRQELDQLRRRFYIPARSQERDARVVPAEQRGDTRTRTSCRRRGAPPPQTAPRTTAAAGRGQWPWGKRRGRGGLVPPASWPGGRATRTCRCARRARMRPHDIHLTVRSPRRAADEAPPLWRPHEDEARRAAALGGGAQLVQPRQRRRRRRQPAPSARAEQPAYAHTSKPRSTHARAPRWLPWHGVVCGRSGRQRKAPRRRAARRSDARCHCSRRNTSH